MPRILHQNHLILETQYDLILQKLDDIKPSEYARSRNFLNGGVTQLSPYISRGVISTLQVKQHLLQKGFTIKTCERLFQQMAWREYFQRVWQHFPNLHHQKVKNETPHLIHGGIPQAVLDAKTGIIAIDKAIEELYEKGTMHNHMRMYVAMMVCNVAKCDWRDPATWMYSHLLDADVASNYLSWQWICGAFSSKLYYANQENINKYSDSNQTETFLDVQYEDFSKMNVPPILFPKSSFIVNSSQEAVRFPEIISLLQWRELPRAQNKQLLLYTPYHLDPMWRIQETAERVLLLDTKTLDVFPMGLNVLEFVIGLSKNIKNLLIVLGDVDDFIHIISEQGVTCSSKEHPLLPSSFILCDEREWMYPEYTGLSPSFFHFWKKCETSERKSLQKIHK